MDEPFSIVVSATGILGTATQIARELHTFADDLRDAPEDLR